MTAKIERTEVLVNEICERLSVGEPLRAICRSDHMPSWMTVYKWIREDSEFAKRVSDARDLGYDALSEQCLDISDDETHDWILSKKGTVTNEVAIARAKLQVWTRLQLLAKWNPKKYGEKSTTTVQNPDGSNFSGMTVNVVGKPSENAENS